MAERVLKGTELPHLLLLEARLSQREKLSPALRNGVFLSQFLNTIWESYPDCPIVRQFVDPSHLPQEIRNCLPPTSSRPIAIHLEPPQRRNYREGRDPQPNWRGIGVAFEEYPTGCGIEFMIQPGRELGPVNCYPYGEKGGTMTFTEFLLQNQGNEDMFTRLACQLAILWVEAEIKPHF